MRIKRLARGVFGERFASSLDARLGGERLGQEPLAFDRDLVALLHATLALPRFLRVGPRLDHLVPKQETYGQGHLDLPLLDGPEVREPILELRELQGLVLFVPLVMRLGLVELPKDCEQRGSDRVLALVGRLRAQK